MSDKTWEFLRECGFKVDYTQEELAEFARIKEVQDAIASNARDTVAKRAAEKKEAAQKEAAQKEAAQKEAAQKEAAQKEAAQKEADRKARLKEYYKLSPEDRREHYNDILRVYNARWREKHREQYNAYMREYAKKRRAAK